MQSQCPTFTLGIQRWRQTVPANESVRVGMESTTTGVTTPYPIQTGVSSTCDKFNKFVSDDSCVDIANEYGTSTSSFYAWNPAVKNYCIGLQADEYVYVAVA